MGIIIGLVLIALLAFAAVGWVAFGWWYKDAKRLEEHVAHADEDLAKLFDGSPQVVYRAPDTSGGLPMEHLIAGANRHGYRLVSETGQLAARRVVFERVSSDLSR